MKPKVFPQFLLSLIFIAGWAQAQPRSNWTIFPASGASQFGLDFAATSIQPYGPYLYLSNQTSNWHVGTWYDTRTQTFSTLPPEIAPVGEPSPNSDRVLLVGSTLYYGQPCFSMESQARCVITRDIRTGNTTGISNGPSNFYGSRSTAYVGSLLRVGNDVYAGGWFTQSGPENDRQPTNSIARWDGQQWNTLRGGITGSDHPQVRFIGHLPGRLFIAGSFEAAGGLPARRMAWFNLEDRTWNTLPTEPEGFVTQMKVHDPFVYVAGDFALRGLPGGDVANVRLARLDTRTMAWEVLPLTATSSPFNIQALHVDDTQILIGGEFSSISGVSASNIARWNGAVWEALGTGTNAPVEALHVQDGFIYAGGNFTRAGGLSIRGAARFNTGSGAWEPLEMVQPLVGLYEGTVFALNAGPGGLVAGGSLPVLGADLARHLVQAPHQSTSISELAGGVALAGDSARVRAVVREGSTLFVGGLFSTAGGLAGFQNVAQLEVESGRWHALNGGVNGEVYALLRHGDYLIVGGSFTRAGTVEARNLARYHLPTQTWQVYGDGAFSTVRALTLYRGDLVIAGDFTAVDWTGANRIARWDGVEWIRMGTGLNAAAHALAAIGDDLYVGGAFSHAGGNAVNRVARWDGQAWHPLGSGVSNTVHALFATEREVFVGGTFTRANSAFASSGIEANGIARFNRTSGQWEPMESGLGPVFALAGWSSGVYAGGAFPGRLAFWEAGYATPTHTSDLPSAEALALYPNPSRGNVLQVRYTARQLGPVVAQVFDVLGRQMLAQEADDSGRLTLSVAGLPAGTYALVLNTPSGPLTQTFTRLP